MTLGVNLRILCEENDTCVYCTYNNLTSHFALVLCEDNKVIAKISHSIVVVNVLTPTISYCDFDADGARIWTASLPLLVYFMLH